MTGRGKGGSWQIRGRQLGEAIGASFDGSGDAAILVKRSGDGLLEKLRGIPIVWDVVDAWPQPVGNWWDKETALSWLREEVRRIKPAAIVAATRQMAVDLDVDVPVLWLPHHARKEELNPIRERVHAMGYQGGNYLGKWRPMLDKQCKARGWRFVDSPESLSDLDIVVALREANGYPARNWKSGVKLANAQASGTPFIGSPEAGYLETQSGAECWAENEQGLAASMDRLVDYRVRAETSRTLRSAAPHLPEIADRYKAWLQTLKF